MQLESRFDSGTEDAGDWRSDSAAPLHGDGRGFESLIAYSKQNPDQVKPLSRPP